MEPIAHGGPPDSTESRALNRSLAAVVYQRLNLDARPVCRLAAGSCLLRAGDPVGRIAYLESGRVDVVMHTGPSGGRDVIPADYAGGELVMLSSVFGDQPCPVDLIACEAVRLRWVGLGELEAAMLRDRDLLVGVARFLAQRLREVQRRERGWIERGVRERVSAALLRLTADAPTHEQRPARIRVTHDEIAARSGVSRPKASRELKRLEQAGAIRLARGAIEIVALGR